jgi:hypothetical protein
MSDDVRGWTELHRTFGENANWKVDRDCVYLNGERILNGVEIGCPSDGGRRYLVKTVRTAFALRDEFDAKFPDGR